MKTRCIRLERNECTFIFISHLLGSSLKRIDEQHNDECTIEVFVVFVVVACAEEHTFQMKLWKQKNSIRILKRNDTICVVRILERLWVVAAQVTHISIGSWIKQQHYNTFQPNNEFFDFIFSQTPSTQLLWIDWIGNFAKRVQSKYIYVFRQISLAILCTCSRLRNILRWPSAFFQIDL